MSEDIQFVPTGKLLTQANPAAGGLPAGFTVPAGSRYMLLVARFTLVTSAVVGNRTVGLTLSRGGTEYARALVNQNFVASTTYNENFYLFGGNAQAVGSSLVLGQVASHPALPALASGDTLTWIGNLIDAGDQFSNVVVTVGEV